MILPIGIGIDCRVLASVITPLVNFSLRKTRSLSIHDKTSILNLHVICVISHKIQTVSNLLERDIATISNTGRTLRAFLCRDQDHTIGSTRTIDSRGSCILQNRDTLPQIRNFVCCGLMGWDLIRLVMPMAGIELQIAADVHSCPLPHDAA